MRFQCRHCQCILDIDDCEPGEKVVCGQCGETVEYPESPTSPTAMLGDFAVIRELGEGGMGKVYLARQVSLDRNVALKVLSEKYAENITFIEHFINEARVAASLNHPNIVQAYAVSMENGLYYFAMEYVEGITMKQYLQEHPRMPADQVLHIACDIVSALEYAWRESRLLHRDIKPDNIMITQDGRTKLADLGLAVRQDDVASDDEQDLFGTPQYVAPELLLKYPHDPRSDMYSLGATLYQALTGQYPYTADNVEDLVMEHARTPLKPVRAFLPEEKSGLAAVVEKLLAKRPEHRYQDFASLLKDLELLKNGVSPDISVHPASQIPLDFEAAEPLKLPENWEEIADSLGIAPPDAGAAGPADAGADGKPKTSGGKSHAGLVILLLLLLGGLAAAGGYFWHLRQTGRERSAASEKTEEAEIVPVQKDLLAELRERMASGKVTGDIRKEMEAVSRRITSSAPEYEEYLQLTGAFLEQEMKEPRHRKIEQLRTGWLEEIEKYRIQQEKLRLEAEAKAEKRRLAAEAAAEKKRLAAEKARTIADIRNSKQKTLEDMVFYTREFDFDSAVRGFSMLAVGLEGQDRHWTDEWMKCLDRAAKAYAVIHDSDRKFAGVRLTGGGHVWSVEKIQFGTLEISAEVTERGKNGRREKRKIEKTLDLRLLGNAGLRNLLYAAMKQVGMESRKEEYFGCLLWVRGGEEDFAENLLKKAGGYHRMLAEKKMMRKAFVQGWLRLLKTDKYNRIQAEAVYADLKRHYAPEMAGVDAQFKAALKNRQ